jgi:ribose transport system substrate-binding protein
MMGAIPGREIGCEGERKAAEIMGAGRRRVRYGFAGAVLLASVLLGTTVGGGSSLASTTRTASSAVARLALAKASVARYERIPQFTLKAPSFNARQAAKGKLIFDIPSFSGIPIYDVGDAEMERIAKSLGARWVEYPNQGSPQQWGAGIEQAIAQHASVISLGGTDPNLNIPQLQDAKRAGILVVETQIYNTGVQVPGAAHNLITAERTARFDDAARLEVDWAAVQSSGNAHMLVSTSNEQPPNPGIVAAMQSEMKKVCPSTCSMVVDNVPLTDWATKITPQTETSLVQYPNINWALPVYDAQTDYMVAGIRAAGRVGKVRIASYNGSGSTLREIQQSKGSLVSMDVGENLFWLAWANMDTIMRALAHKPQLPQGGAEQTALRIFWKGNVNRAGVPAGDGKGYGAAYVAGYNKIWGTNISENPLAK